MENLMSIRGLFRKRRPERVEEVPAAVPMSQLFYDIAYFGLPGYIYSRDPTVFSVLCRNGEVPEFVSNLYQFLIAFSSSCQKDPNYASKVFFTSACLNHGVRPDLDDIPSIRWHSIIDFVDGFDCFVVEFPRLPSPGLDEFGDAVDILARPERALARAMSHHLTLPPLYAAIVCPASKTIMARHNANLPPSDCHFTGQFVILGAAPDSGTTYRTVLADGSNQRLGSGPDEPDLQQFLATLYSSFVTQPESSNES